jgi:hypothetical protein
LKRRLRISGISCIKQRDDESEEWSERFLLDLSLFKYYETAGDTGRPRVKLEPHHQNGSYADDDDDDDGGGPRC